MSNVDTSAAYFYCFAVPEPTPRPRSITAAVAIGALEALGLTAYGVSIIAFERGSTTTGISGSGADLAPAVLIALFIVFAGLVLLVTGMVRGGRRAARTPFLLVQAFALVIAQPLLSASDTRILGVLIALGAVAGVASLVMPSAREYLK